MAEALSKPHRSLPLACRRLRTFIKFVTGVTLGYFKREEVHKTYETTQYLIVAKKNVCYGRLKKNYSTV